MIESRKAFELTLGDGSILYRVVIKSPLVEPHTETSRFMISNLLKMIGSTPDVLNHNGLQFEKLSIEFKEGRWTVETKAVKEVK